MNIIFYIGKKVLAFTLFNSLAKKVFSSISSYSDLGQSDG
ncbi:hypothetical protein SLEP1_g26688 [Rubroshorea leprosula]|uniref:Uncharacterized protein n=1 Tax=Rubroshorea leprosula TaxID=152421 RepID=A0AAV5JMW9_9ROSI|nr:hypothetical protein SLEP1_g26688 [Rubroshorea leprosula]